MQLFGFLLMFISTFGISASLVCILSALLSGEMRDVLAKSFASLGICTLLAATGIICGNMASPASNTNGIAIERKNVPLAIANDIASTVSSGRSSPAIRQGSDIATDISADNEISYIEKYDEPNIEKYDEGYASESSVSSASDVSNVYEPGKYTSASDASDGYVPDAYTSDGVAKPYYQETALDPVLDIPAYTGNPYVEINNNVPYFQNSDLNLSAFEQYSDLDLLGRCGAAYACLGKETMPTEERGPIGMIKPSGWHTVKYNGVISDNYLYNRCHLIGYQLAGENDNPKNLITGTRYMNIDGMLPFENKIANYIDTTNNHVLYRVTPIFNGDNLVANGVQMEAESIEDNGTGIMFHVFCYNVQPGIGISYSDGDSWLDGTITPQQETTGSSADNSASDRTTEEWQSWYPEQDDEQDYNSPSNPGATQGSGRYVVNGNNGKIHINGACSATKEYENSMNNPIYFDSYEEAEAYSIQNYPDQEGIRCKKCWDEVNF